jgi:hypothetical protein
MIADNVDGFVHHEFHTSCVPPKIFNFAPPTIYGGTGINASYNLRSDPSVAQFMLYGVHSSHLDKVSLLIVTTLILPAVSTK